MRITGYEDQGNAVILVSDDGEGMTPERLSQVRQSLAGSTGKPEDIYGMYNVAERIRLNFGEEYGLEIDSKLHVGTKVLVRLPMR